MSSFRGKVRVELEGEAYNLVLDMNAFAEFEALSGINYRDTVKALEVGMLSARSARELVAACAIRNHPDITLMKAGDILSANTDIIIRLFAAAAPSPAEVARLGNSSAPATGRPTRKRTTKTVAP